jgi:hypothetical protein
MRLIFLNFYKYNSPESDVAFIAKKLEEAFEIRYAKFHQYKKTIIIILNHNN